MEGSGDYHEEGRHHNIQGDGDDGEGDLQVVKQVLLLCCEQVSGKSSSIKRKFSAAELWTKCSVFSQTNSWSGMMLFSNWTSLVEIFETKWWTVVTCCRCAGEAGSRNYQRKLCTREIGKLMNLEMMIMEILSAVEGALEVSVWVWALCKFQPADLRRLEDARKWPHQCSVHSHQLLVGHHVRLNIYCSIANLSFGRIISPYSRQFWSCLHSCVSPKKNKNCV